jgi:hypothetical protein
LRVRREDCESRDCLAFFLIGDEEKYADYDHKLMSYKVAQNSEDIEKQLNYYRLFSIYTLDT